MRIIPWYHYALVGEELEIHPVLCQEASNHLQFCQPYIECSVPSEFNHLYFDMPCTLLFKLVCFYELSFQIIYHREAVQ